jgi:hypothetical protein
MMKRQRNYTKGERAIIYTAIAAGATVEEVNNALADEQQVTGMTPRDIPQSSYDMVKKRYLGTIVTTKDLWEAINNPKPIGKT